ncbi:hypothetical protein [Natroniella sp. ANB-PHB2]|uniref:hypothetical protein n=1 Tax=Natroniella sp. ANB-PHB2 TaxID=3384444 RepID=UPI0038D3839D
MKKRVLFTVLILLIVSLFSVSAMANEVIGKEVLEKVLEENGEDSGVAEITLKNVSNRAYSRRMIRGKTLLAAGGTRILLTASTGEDLINDTGLITGIGLGLAGLQQLFIPTVIEKEYEGIKSYPANHKELASFDSLNYLATRSRQLRLASAITSTGGALYFLARNSESTIYNIGYDNYLGLILAGNAIYKFASPTYIEKAYDKVENAIGGELYLSVGEFIGPVYSYNF